MKKFFIKVNEIVNNIVRRFTSRPAKSIKAKPVETSNPKPAVEVFAFYSRRRSSSVTGYQAYVTDQEGFKHQVNVEQDLAKNPRNKELQQQLERAKVAVENCVKNHTKQHLISKDGGSYIPIGYQVSCLGCGTSYFTCTEDGSQITDPPLKS